MYHARVFCKQKKKEKLINRSREREGKKKSQAAKYQTERERRKRVSNIVGKLSFFSPPPSPLRFRIIQKSRPIVHRFLISHPVPSTDTRIHKRVKWRLPRSSRYSSMKIETKHANFLTRENYSRETSY